jgi:hypothetical protein
MPQTLFAASLEHRSKGVFDVKRLATSAVIDLGWRTQSPTLMKNTSMNPLLLALLVCLPLTSFAADKNSPTPSPSPKASPNASAAHKMSPAASGSPSATTSGSPAAAKRPRPIAFHGMVSLTDSAANSFTIAGKAKSRVFLVTNETVITKAGAPATLNEITANTEVSGSYWKNPDGTLAAKIVKIGPVKEQKAKAKGAATESPTPSATEASPKP